MSVATLEALERAVAGLIAALIVVRLAQRAGMLSASGGTAATILGMLAVGAGWHWGALLVTFFAASSLLSRWRVRVKSARTSAVVAKGGRRDAWQVLANGGVFGVAALGEILHPHPAWALAGAGALAAATADTWATEIGTALSPFPRAVLTLKRVPPGTSGAVSGPGTVASILGALFIAVMADRLGFPRHLAALTGAGLAGAAADTLLGATLQSRRWCDACAEPTERNVHRCGSATRPAGGLAWLGNDAVNLACTLVGAGTALLLWRLR